MFFRERRVCEYGMRRRVTKSCTTEVKISKNHNGVTVQFGDKPSEDILNCLRRVFEWHGYYWRTSADGSAYRAIRDLIATLRGEGWNPVL